VEVPAQASKYVGQREGTAWGDEKQQRDEHFAAA